MSFSYATPATSDVHRVRRLIGDTTSGAGNYVFEDAEVQDALDDEGGDRNLAAASLLRTLAVDAAKRAIDWRVNGVGLSRGQRADQLLRMAETLEKKAVAVPYEYESVPDRSVTVFGEDRSNYMDSSEAT